MILNLSCLARLNKSKILNIRRFKHATITIIL
nr:MAG TPA: hypothetical protein [Caudoviricetes sp.]